MKYIFTLILLFFLQIGFAQDGSIDSTFGTNGRVLTFMNSGSDRLNFVAVQNDDKILAGGYVIYDTINHKNAFALIRYHSNGSVDSSFATNGKMIYNFNGGSANANTIKIQSDGKIILAGNATSGTLRGFAAIRLNTDGSLDTTFANNGSLITSISNIDDRVYTIALHNDGRIMFGGYSRNSTYGKLALARYDANGNIDTTFNNTGIVIYALSGNTVICTGMVIDSIGNYIVCGNISYTSSSSGFLRKYSPVGTLVTSFGTNGTWATGVGNGFHDNITKILNQPDGKMLVGNTSDYNAPKKFALLRYLPSNWAQDGTFGIGTGGTAYFNSGVTSYAATDFTLQSDGKILVTGNYQNGSIKSIATVRYTAAGLIDSTFGNNGIVVEPFVANDNTSSSGIAVQTNGGIIVAGTYTQININHYALMKYNGTSITVNELDNTKDFADFKIFPNPASDFLNMKSNTNLENATISIVDLLGNTILYDRNSIQNSKFSIQNLTKGVYFLRANLNGNVITKKFIKN